MKAGLYKRVSTLEQTKYGYSIEAQEEKMRAYCNAMNYEVYRVYTDDGFTGATLNRPGIRDLIDSIKKHDIDIVIIYKLDRLSRDVRNTLDLVDIFVENNVQLYSLSEQIDLTSPFGRAALTMSATFSAMEREVIRQRSILGKEQRVKSGKMMGMGSFGAPFGYKLISKEKRFEIVEEEAEMVRDIFNCYVNEDYTIRKLYPYMREKYKHPFFSNPMCCKDILKRSMYAGYFTYKGEEIKGTNFEPIIPYTLYLQAQEKMKKNTTTRTHEASPYLLTGLVYCGQCGNRYVGKRSQRYSKLVNGGRNFHDDTYYACAARVKRDKNYTPAKCMNKIFPAQTLDDMVSEKLTNLTFTDFVEEHTPQVVYDSLYADIQAQEAKKEKLLDLYLEEKITKEVFESRSEECDKIIDKNKMALEAEKEKLANQPTITIDYLKEKQAEFHTASKAEKRRTLKLFIKHISIVDGKVNITWRVK